MLRYRVLYVVRNLYLNHEGRDFRFDLWTALSIGRSCYEQILVLKLL